MIFPITYLVDLTAAIDILSDVLAVEGDRFRDDNDIAAWEAIDTLRKIQHTLEQEMD